MPLLPAGGLVRPVIHSQNKSRTVIVTAAVTKIAGRVSFAMSFASEVWK